jgi:protein-tyrosine phosphatase
MRIIMLCHGNICRSPLAMGILRKKLSENNIEAVVDSAGFEPYHIGDHADERAIQVAKKHGIDLSDHIARLFRRDDFDNNDYIFVMDRGNHRDALYMARNDSDKARVDYIMNLVHPATNAEVPDPYYGGLYNFEEVYSLLDQACDKLIDKIKK